MAKRSVWETITTHVQIERQIFCFFFYQRIEKVSTAEFT